MKPRLVASGRSDGRRRFVVSYSDGPGAPVMQWRCWAVDAEDAEERFYGDPFAQDWHILSVRRAPEGGAS